MAHEHTTDIFRSRLVSLLTQWDIRLSRKDNNIYRLGIMLRAVQSTMDEICKDGASFEDAFMNNFTPCREMHAIAKKLDLALDVQRGHWVKGGVNAHS